MTVRVGIIGTGVMGADHARMLGSTTAGATVGAVFDLDRDRASAAVAGIPDARVLDDPLSLVKDADVDAVLVASSDATHEEFVLACLGAGKPVLCEKPLAPHRGRVPAGGRRRGRVRASTDLGRLHAPL